VKISNIFIDKGEEIVSTKGKVSQWDRAYKATYDPLDTDIPVVVLVNSGSASASEIVSGAIQDLDRGVVIGQRTFGKGLVQTTRPLSYNAKLKVTTAKYYIPSGRCIQALDYSHRRKDGSVGKIPDSLISKFKIIWIENKDNDFSLIQTGIAVPKRNLKKAHQRNLVKRRIREAYRLNKCQVHDYLAEKKKCILLLIIYNHKQILPYRDIEAKIKNILIRLVADIDCIMFTNHAQEN